MRDLFNSDMPEIAIEKPIRLIELFAGYSSQAMALRRIGADFEIWHTSEWLWQSNRSHLAVFHGNACPDHSAGMTRGEVAEALLRLAEWAAGRHPFLRNGEALCIESGNSRRGSADGLWAWTIPT